MFCSREIQCHFVLLKQFNFVFLCSNHHCRSCQRQAKSRWFCWGSRLCSRGFCLSWRISVWHLGSSRGCKKWQSLGQWPIFQSGYVSRYSYTQILVLSQYSRVRCSCFKKKNSWLQLAVHYSTRDLELSLQFHMYIIILWQFTTLAAELSRPQQTPECKDQKCAVSLTRSWSKKSQKTSCMNQWLGKAVIVRL